MAYDDTLMSLSTKVTVNYSSSETRRPVVVKLFAGNHFDGIYAECLSQFLFMFSENMHFWRLMCNLVSVDFSRIIHVYASMDDDRLSLNNTQ